MLGRATEGGRGGEKRRGVRELLKSASKSVGSSGRKKETNKAPSLLLRCEVHDVNGY